MNAQEVCRALGSSGCYFLSLLHLISAEPMAVGVFNEALGYGIIDADCYVKDPAKLLSLVVGGKWKVWHANAGYKPLGGELEILRFERKDTTITYAHFVVGDGNGNVEYDPLGNSKTVTGGRLVSKRIVKRIT